MRISNDELVEKVSEEVCRRQTAREEHYDRNRMKHAQRAEIERAKLFEGSGSRRGLTPVAHFTTTHADRLAKTYGSDWMRDKKAIAHAAERDPSVRAQRENLMRVADALR